MSPVLYADKDEFADYVDEVLINLENEADLMREVEAAHPDSSFLADLMFNVFRFAVVSTKHPGFREEREWRVIYHPRSIIEVPSEERRIVEANVTISGMPQIVHKLSFTNYEDHGLVGATLPEILHKLIIGPTAYPWVLFHRLRTALRGKDVPLNDGKVDISKIPLRH
jgi:hypothetical protein